MTAAPIIPVILCGGSGTRLWPLSRKSFPKQFVPLLGKQSTFQQTLQRVADRGLFGRPGIATNDAYRFMAESQAREALIQRKRAEELAQLALANQVRAEEKAAEADLHRDRIRAPERGEEQRDRGGSTD